MKYKILWEALKDTAETLTEEGFDDLSWHTLLNLMNDGEKMVESEKWYTGTVLSTVVKAFGFSIACWGVIALVMHVIGG